MKYLSERLGQAMITNVSQGEISQSQAASGFRGTSFSQSFTPLLTAEEVGRFFSRQIGAQILLWSGSNPIAAERVEYYRHPMFAGKFQPRGA